MAPIDDKNKAEDEARKEELSRQRQTISESAKLAAQMQQQIKTLNMVDKTLAGYNKGIAGALAGVIQASVTQLKLNKEHERQLVILKKEIDKAEASGNSRRKAELIQQKTILEQTGKLNNTIQSLEVLQNALSGFVKTVRETQQQFGVTAGQAAKIGFNNLAASISSYAQSITSLGKFTVVSSEQIQKAQVDFQEEFGGVLTSDAAKSLAQEAVRLGITTAQMAKARRAFLTTTLGDVSRAKAETDRFIGEFAKKGLTATDAMNAIAQNSDLLARNGTRFATAFARAAADAKKIGVELSKVDQLADNIIDNFEGFLEAQAELGAMGVGFDTSRLAELSVSGDTAAFQEELRTQLRQLGPQLMNLNRPQQLALQQMSGMTMAELQRLAGITEGSGEATLTIDEQNNSLLSRTVALIEAAILPGLTLIAGIMSLHTGLLTSIAMSTAAGAAGSGLTGLLSFMGKIMGVIGPVISAVATMLPILLGIAAALGIGYLAYKAITGDDVISKPGYGKRKLITESGIVSLNNQDNIVAYADDIVSDPAGVTTLPKGSLLKKSLLFSKSIGVPDATGVDPRLGRRKYPSWVHPSDYAFADSLLDATNSNPEFRRYIESPMDSAARGGLTPNGHQMIAYNLLASDRYISRDVLAHEVGHLYDFHPKNRRFKSAENLRFTFPEVTLGENMTVGTDSRSPAYAETYNPYTGRNQLYRTDVNPYSQISNQEAYAEAFKEAWKFLSDPMIDVARPNTVRNKMVDIELRYPGFSSIVEDLTQLDTFKGTNIARNMGSEGYYRSSEIEKMSDQRRIKENRHPELAKFWQDAANVTRYHLGGIVGMNGSKNEVPAILQKGEAVLTQPQYQRVEELTNLATMAGLNQSPASSSPIPEVKIDLTRLEQTMGQLLNAFSGFQINMDGNRISRILNTTTQAATRIGVLEQQNVAVTNR